MNNSEPPPEKITEKIAKKFRTEERPDVEAPREGVEQHPPMTIKRFMAIFSLGCLLAAAQIPLYLIGGSLGILSIVACLMVSIHGSGYWRTRFIRMSPIKF
jgi:hypothetical protein